MDHNIQTHSPPLAYGDFPYAPERPAPSAKAPAKSLAFSMVSGASYVSLGMNQLLSECAPDGECCAITRNVKPIEACHLIGKATKSDLQAKIESAWGTETGQFSTNCVANLIWLTRDMHNLFDDDHWALVPTRAVLTEMMAFNTVRPKPKPYNEMFPDEIREFHYVQFKSLPAFIMQFTDNKLRNFPQYSSEAGLPAPAQPEIDFPAYEIHRYPFESLGVIKSHAHPFFVTYNTGQKMHRLRKANGDLQLPPHANNYLFELGLSEALYNSWMGST
ncbi:unnamed protein product, partial [Rhizoctonia solani]